MLTGCEALHYTASLLWDQKTNSINQVCREARIRMAKNTADESDETRLKKKITARGAEDKGVQEGGALRSLRKRLKRTQRKRRSLALRKKNSASKKTTAPEAKK